jgi:hypothetical protein
MEFLKALRSQWDRSAAFALVVLGLLVLLLGYFGVSGTAYVSEQMPYIISGGIFGLCLIITGATLWLSADLRDEWRKLHSLDERLEQVFGSAPTSAPTATPTAEALEFERVPDSDPMVDTTVLPAVTS